MKKVIHGKHFSDRDSRPRILNITKDYSCYNITFSSISLVLAHRMMNSFRFAESDYNHKPHKARFLTSNNMALSAALFRKIGGFDANRLRAAAEDREFCDRWLYRGYRMIYIPNAVVYHAHNSVLRSFWRQHFKYGFGAFYFHRVRANRSQESIKLEPRSLYMNMLRYPFSELEGWEGLSLAFLLAISQIANAAGFFWEMGDNSIRSRNAR